MSNQYIPSLITFFAACKIFGETQNIGKSIQVSKQNKNTVDLYISHPVMRLLMPAWFNVSTVEIPKTG